MTPKWDGQRWRIRIMREGRSFSFSSSTLGAKGRKEVIQKYEAWLFDEGSGTKSVEKVAQEYLEDLKARNGDDSESYIQNERYIRLYILPKTRGRKMCKMTLREWQGILNSASGRNKPLSHKTLQNLRGIISGLIKYGYSDYQCELPRGELYIPKGHSKAEKEILQPKDIRKLMDPSDRWYHPLFCFLCITGLRPGEALGLQRGDIYEDHVVIRRAVNYRGKITPGKNENARRMVPIGALASGILRKTIRRNDEMKLRTDWVFCSPDGSPGKQSTMRNQWLELKAERDLPGTVYSLRHTFISTVKNLMPEQMIKDIVGHSVSMDTFGTYGHIVDGEQQRAAEIIDLSFGQNLGQNKSISGEQTK